MQPRATPATAKAEANPRGIGTLVTSGVIAGAGLWPASRPWAGGAFVVVGAMGFTAWSEWYNVYRTGAWSYASEMPTVYGIGLSPLLQWLILPPAIVVAYRTLLPVLFGKSDGD